jgi:hypothetical protein
LAVLIGSTAILSAAVAVMATVAVLVAAVPCPLSSRSFVVVVLVRVAVVLSVLFGFAWVSPPWVAGPGGRALVRALAVGAAARVPPRAAGAALCMTCQADPVALHPCRSDPCRSDPGRAKPCHSQACRVDVACCGALRACRAGNRAASASGIPRAGGILDMQSMSGHIRLICSLI